MLPSFTQLVLYPVQLEDRDRRNVDCVVCPKGRSQCSFCADEAKSGLTHFITSLFLSFFLPPSLCSILKECRRQASRHFCIHFPPFMYSWLCPTSSIPEANVFATQTWLLWYTSSHFFICHYIKEGAEKLWNIQKTLLGSAQESQFCISERI